MEADTIFTPLCSLCTPDGGVLIFLFLWMSSGNCNQEPGFVLRQRTEQPPNWSLKGVKVTSARWLHAP